MIRRAVTCDMCGTEKREVNHWFVASAVNGELRIERANAQSMQRPGALDVCGELCMHKLVSEYLEGSLSLEQTPEIAASGTTAAVEPRTAGTAHGEASRIPMSSSQISRCSLQWMERANRCSGGRGAA